MQPFRRLLKRASTAPFFQRKFGGLKTRDILDLNGFAEKVPTTGLEELVREKMRSGDLYSSRACRTRRPLVTFQLAYDTEAPLYLALDRFDLRVYAEALTRCWSLIGLKGGDKVAIFDYGTSPVSYLASSVFTPYLSRGAADALGCLSICNDGVSNMSQRAVEILRFVRPRVLFVRADCLEPLAIEVEKELPRLADYTQALIAVENEGLLSKPDQNSYERRLGVPVYRLLRVDVAMFFAMECPRCRLLHGWRDLYLVESVTERADDSEGHGQGSLVITNWFARACPTVRYLSQVRGSLQPAGCPRGAKDFRIAA